uniref:Uncharacterized protein LOC111124330 n=1 Tax=Crassostrea virginica TaxID=6565 RepID=A0A8B8D5T0_CRAVI|nr:uncharacterized protein LOC111124330 [Crassostrea virginica]
MNLRLIIVFTCNLGFTGQIVAPCTFLTEWDGLWYDSRKKEVTLSQTTSAVLSGWTVNAYASSVTSWTCVEQSADAYLMKGDQNVNVFGSLHSAYLCLRVALVTDVSFTYTIQSDEQSNAGGERVTILPATTNASLSGDCVAASPPGPEEYHVLVKADNVSNVRQYFPEPLLAVLYNSAFVKTGPVCDSDVILDMCSDRSTMNRTECSAVLGQVSVSEYYCVAHVQDGANFYVSLLNPQTTGSNQQHFLCLAVTKLNSQVYISDNIGSCAKGQDPGVKQPNGTEALVMYASVLCPFETSTAEETSDVGLIIGSVIASLVILGLILAITIVCLRKKCRDKIRTRCCSRCGKRVNITPHHRNKLWASTGSDKENGTETAVTSDQELSVSPAENMEFGKAPVDVRKDICLSTVHEPAVTSINELKDPDDQDVMMTSGKNSSQFLRQKTEEDMAELRRINERVNLAKNQ